MAVASIICGNGLAFMQLKSFDYHNWIIFFLTLWVALALQILSNLANDYGDGVKGVDTFRDTLSPERMFESGQIQSSTFKQIIYIWAFITFCSGIALITIGFDNLKDFLIFLTLGVIAIIAAMAYTMGKRPYGYRAMGEVAVLIFFGWLGVLGSAYLQTGQLKLSHLIPATGCGGLAACVLFINNMRDIYTDEQAGKITLAVLIGDRGIQTAYALLFMAAYMCYLTYAINFNWYALSVLMVFPLAIKHSNAIHRSRLKNLSEDDQVTRIDTISIGKQLKIIVKIALITNLLFVAGIAISLWV